MAAQCSMLNCGSIGFFEMCIFFYLKVLSTSEQTCKEEVSTCGQSRVTKLCNKDIRRYSRQLILPEVGVQGKVVPHNYLIL